MPPYVLAMAMEDSSNVIVKTPNTETPPQPQPIIGNSISFSGGASAKRRPHAAEPVVVFYRECLKNHAMGISGLALDECGEFRPSATDPASLKCTACSCRRNFHRRELDDPSSAHFISFHRGLPPPLSLSLTPSPVGSPPRDTPLLRLPPNPQRSSNELDFSVSSGNEAGVPNPHNHMPIFLL